MNTYFECTDTEAVLPPLVNELVAAGEGGAALDLVETDISSLLSEGIQCDVDAGTMAGLGINGGNPLPFVDWMNALVDEEVAALPDSDQAINSIVRDLLVGCHSIVSVMYCTAFLDFFTL